MYDMASGNIDNSYAFSVVLSDVLFAAKDFRMLRLIVPGIHWGIWTAAFWVWLAKLHMFALCQLFITLIVAL